MELAAFVLTIGMAWEVIDEREFRLLARDFLQGDFRLFTMRVEEIGDAPSVSFARYLPDRNTAAECLCFNRHYKSWLELRISIEQNPVVLGSLLTTLQETERLYQIWDYIRDSQCGYYYVSVRRRYLKLLREHLGEEKFYNLDIPPHVPLWRFHEIN